jgi:hypothetical protein
MASLLPVFIPLSRLPLSLSAAFILLIFTIAVILLLSVATLLALSALSLLAALLPIVLTLIPLSLITLPPLALLVASVVRHLKLSLGMGVLAQGSRYKIGCFQTNEFYLFACKNSYSYPPGSCTA